MVVLVAFNDGGRAFSARVPLLRSHRLGILVSYLVSTWQPSRSFSGKLGRAGLSLLSNFPFPSFLIQNFPSTLLSQPSLTTKQRRDKASINRTKSRTESVGRLSPIIIHAAFSLGGTRGGLSNDLTDTLYHTYTPHFFEQRPRPSDPFPPPVFIFLTIFRVNGR